MIEPLSSVPVQFPTVYMPISELNSHPVARLACQFYPDTGRGRIVVRGRRVSGPRFPCLASVGGLANLPKFANLCKTAYRTTSAARATRQHGAIEVRVPRHLIIGLVCTTQRRRRITASRSTVSCATRDSNPNKQAPGRSAASTLLWQAPDTQTRARARARARI